jgi:hypothetical protein
MNIPLNQIDRIALSSWLLVLIAGSFAVAGSPGIRGAAVATPASRPGSATAENTADAINSCFEKASRVAAITFNELDRAETFEAVATVQYKAGDSAGARRNLTAARRNIEAERFADIRSRAYLHLAETYEQGGDRELAQLALEAGIRDAVTEKDPHYRETYLLPLAQAQAHCRAPGVEATWAVVSKSAHNEGAFRSFDMSDLAGALADAGKGVEARSVAGEIDDHLGQSLAWEAIAKAQLKAGDIDAATKTAALIPDDWIAQRTVAKIAVAQAAAGNIRTAEVAVRRLTEDTARSKALVGIVRARLRIRELDNAALAAAAISDPLCHIEAAHALAQAQIKAGNLDTARKFAADAITDARNIEAESWDMSCQAFCEAATIQGQVGDFAAAGKCFDQARRALDKADGNSLRWEGIRKWKLMRRIAVTRLEIGDIEGAKQTIAAMDVWNAEDEKALACQAVGFALTRSQSLPAAERWINSLDSNRAQAYAWVGAAEALLHDLQH